MPFGGNDWHTLTEEPTLEPEIPICDPHHHLWDRPNNRYMLEDLIEDTRGHNVRQTVFVECTSMYRADGPEELRVVGETEFVQGVAAKSASGGYGETRVATGIQSLILISEPTRRYAISYAVFRLQKKT